MIAIVGGKKSGKTTTIEVLTKELTKRGYRIAVAKHIPEANFTIDKEGKDTWRYAQSGATTIIGASANEIATIEKAQLGNFSLEQILQRCEGNDIVLLEGFRKLVARDINIPKIVVVKSAQDVEEAIETFEPILAFTGSYSTEKSNLKIPYIDIFGDSKTIVDLVEKVLKEKL
jgi:molybdopterin-guanine dinucleotide biosynthesis protein B